MKDGLDPNLAFKILSLQKYLHLRVLETRELGKDKILQICFAKKALLKAIKYLKPKPPIIFGIHIFSHFLH